MESVFVFDLFDDAYKPYINAKTPKEVETSTTVSVHSAHSSTTASDFVTKYKTEMCKFWKEEGFCLFGQQCSFAHGVHELRDKMSVKLNKKYRTKECRKFVELGCCPYGERCQFSHAKARVPHTPEPVVYFRRQLSYMEELEKIAQIESAEELETKFYYLEMKKPKLLQLLRKGQGCCSPHDVDSL